ncbi:coagulation factor XIII A chain-like [Diadema antillarum]|uniref:coagulation factor XIII A chain-like n=1 Tax=Diadema antillarum TaxID=105358 RepID=UPI003A8BE447
MGSGSSSHGSASSRRSVGSNESRTTNPVAPVSITVTVTDETGLRPSHEWTDKYFSNLPASDPYSDDDLETVLDDDMDARSVVGEEMGASPVIPTKMLHAHMAKPFHSKLQPLQIHGVDFHLDTNQPEHHTESYENQNLVIRRAQNFKLTVRTSRKYVPERETLYMRFAAMSKHPRQSNGTLILLPIHDSDQSNGWSIALESSDDGSVRVIVCTAVTSIIGPYSLTVVIKNNRTGLQREFKEAEPIYLLFNPWCRRDPVYMENEEERREYVLEDQGEIWKGNYRCPLSQKWNFGHLDKDVVDTVFGLLHDYVRVDDRGNPVKVARILPAVLNAAGRLPGGVLAGSWDSKYAGGMAPTQWQGSVKILEEYRRTKQPVKFGQCWVFAGLFTTVFRCMGIPARCITNYSSAHDSDDSMVIDKFVDDNGVDIRGGDSVWLYHVWNEAWMTRPDLDPGFDGWQAVDVTPQDTSEGIYQCGPAPVAAIKRGSVNQGHETRFMFAELNADRVTWMVKPDKHHRNNPESAGYELVDVEKNAVGKLLCTKAVGSDEFQDVTMDYKYSAGSGEEKATVEMVLAKGMRRGFYNVECPDHDVAIYLNDLNDAYIGDSFELKARISNLSDETRTATLIVSLQSTLYTGIIRQEIKKKKMVIRLEARDLQDHVLPVLVDEYVDKIEEQGLLTVFVLLTIKETDKTISKREDIRLQIPRLEVNSEVTGSEVILAVEFTNPLEKVLTNCSFEVEGSNLVKPFSVKQEDIPGKGSICRNISFKARNTGLKYILVGFHCSQLKDVSGSVLIQVRSL